MKKMVRSSKEMKKKKNKVVIIIDAENDEKYEEIEKELLSCVRKLNRKTKELGYYITPKERTKSVMLNKFFYFRLEVPTHKRRTFYAVKRGTVITPVFVERTFLEVFKGIIQSMKSRFCFGKRKNIERRIF